ncbi:C69 family dipeptidase [Prauserella flavalba]|uniref:C69 family dipeptidase n=1 Tax=Prauserella flavalba TaxID=1477506 RepID=UPI00143DC8A9|nr:C69 family dipeptidase [Prauserella flavalba]
MPSTEGEPVLLGKNSDRPVFDAQPLRFFPRRSASGAGRLPLAYVELPEAAESFAHLGGSPYWCWGHEIGLSERGVAIGNEALFTRDVAANIAATNRGEVLPRGILGMELVRLGLERGRSAEDAVEVMAELVQRYGQWGSGVPGRAPVEGAYDNSYLVADSREAWVLETSGRRWAAKRIDRGTYAISNQPTIRRSWDAGSPDLLAHAVRSGWWPEQRGELDFARAYTDPAVPLQASHLRLSRSRQLLAEATDLGGVDVPGIKRILRDHYEDTFLNGPYFTAALPDFLSLCMHSHPAGFTWGNTASSSVCVLPREGEGLPHLWWTPLTPCTGVYLPVFVAAGTVPEDFTRAGATAARARPEDAAPDSFSSDSYWWRFHQLLEAVKGDALGWDFDDRRPIVRAAFDPLEARWAARLPEVEKQALELIGQGAGTRAAAELARFTDDCAREATAVLTELLDGFGIPTGEGRA